MSDGTLRLAETRARRVVLAQVIEVADTQGKLLGDVEREAIDARAAAAIQKAQPGGDACMADMLHQRAAQVVETVGKTSPALAALAEPPHWLDWLAWGLPLSALLLGVATNQIANPHRVDLLSPALLGIVAWNLLVYALMALAALRGVARPAVVAVAPVQTPSPWMGLRRWGASLSFARADRLRQLQAGMAARFLAQWQAVAGTVSAQRLRRLLHLCAAAWGAGVALSLLLRGTVVAYSAGWESTFLDASQVHAVLSMLFAPVVALFSLQPFSVQEIAGMRFGTDGLVSATMDGGRRWALLYVGLLVLLVVLPRLLLAAVAQWQAMRLARRVSLNLDDPYFQRLIDKLFPARVGIAVLAHRPDDEAVLTKVLRPAGDGAQAGAPLMATAMGDLLELVPAHQAAVLLHVVGHPDDLEAPLPVTPQGMAERPVVLMVRTPADGAGAREALLAQCLLHQRNHGFVKAVLVLDDFARCWWQDAVWLRALAGCMQPSRRQGFARLQAAWQAACDERLARSMHVLATQLKNAAALERKTEGTPASVQRLITGEQRDARVQAGQAAMAALVSQAKQGATDSLAALLALHGVNAGEAASLEHRLEEKFAVQMPYKPGQAGAAGAAAGAAMGASVDLLTGGLTLGAAAALGALIGGGTALLGASWKNAGGATILRLSDDMLLALAEAGLLRYLAVIHWGRGPVAARMGSFSAEWQSTVTATVQANRQALIALWRSIREAAESPTALGEGGVNEELRGLAHELENMARTVLARLYPAATDTPAAGV